MEAHNGKTQNCGPAPDPSVVSAELCADPRVVKLAAIFPGELYLVGGTVRDALLGSKGVDLDLATSLAPEEALRLLEASAIRAVPTGLKHGTVTAVFGGGGKGAEITSYRGSGPAGERTIEADLLLRDFTVNALAINARTAQLLDPSGGLEDLRQRLIKAVGKPAARFAEDPLRVLRMVRFASAHGWTLEPGTKDASRAFAESLRSISVERVRDEFSRILVASRPAFALSLLLELGFLEVFMPELARCAGFEQNRFHPLDLFAHTADVVNRTSPDLVLRLAALLHDIGKPPSLSVDEKGERHFFCHEAIGAEMAREILLRLRYPGAVVDAVCVLVSTHMRPVNAGAAGLRRLLRDTGEHFGQWRELKEADTLAVLSAEDVERQLSEFDAAIEEVRRGPDVSPLKNLAINGDDLIALGLKPGPLFGRILRELHERVIEDPALNTREQLIPIALELAQSAAVIGSRDGRGDLEQKR